MSPDVDPLALPKSKSKVTRVDFAKIDTEINIAAACARVLSFVFILHVGPSRQGEYGKLHLSIRDGTS